MTKKRLAKLVAWWAVKLIVGIPDMVMYYVRMISYACRGLAYRLLRAISTKMFTDSDYKVCYKYCGKKSIWEETHKVEREILDWVYGIKEDEV